MDRFQALSLIGFDGPDSFSPKAEIEAEIQRLEAADLPHHPELTARVESLRKMAAKATKAGGFRTAHP